MINVFTFKTMAFSTKLTDHERKMRLANRPQQMKGWLAPGGLQRQVKGFVVAPSQELPLSSLLDPGVLLQVFDNGLNELENSHFGICLFKVPIEHTCIFYNKTNEFNKPGKLEELLKNTCMHLNEKKQSYDKKKGYLQYEDWGSVSGDEFFRDCASKDAISFPDAATSDHMQIGKKNYVSVFHASMKNISVVINKTASLMTPDRRASVATLKDLGRVMEHLGPNHHDFTVEGVTREHLIISPPRSVFGMHIEDWGLAAINYCHFGGRKIWFTINAQFFDAVVDFLKRRFKRNDPHFILKKICFVDPVELMEAGIPVQRVVQEPGTLVLVDSYAFHWGFNAEHNVVEAVNILLPRYFRVRKTSTPLTTKCSKEECQEFFDPSSLLIQNTLNKMTVNEFANVLTNWMQAKKKDLPELPKESSPVDKCGGHAAKKRTNMLRKLAFQLRTEAGKTFLAGESSMANKIRQEVKSQWAIHEPFCVEAPKSRPSDTPNVDMAPPTKRRKE